jgi:hypothetical protein
MVACYSNDLGREQTFPEAYIYVRFTPDSVAKLCGWTVHCPYELRLWLVDPF